MADQGGLGDESKDLTHDEQQESSTGTAFAMPAAAAETEDQVQDEREHLGDDVTEGEAAGDSAADEQIGAADQAVNGSVGL
ncbi:MULTISPECIES: hypothetical protein [unclassified Leifsonia]|uniref:hypothetical protein n=1 Tax=unclassified Leifsonia TaxID=2663824 RepID=UPI0006F94D13|nr:MULTISPECIES: hypothetical protein [unclassified Leifsonia]KQX08193.1 hypothetical protein ASC59_11060 [Leifsonia sp. Root1293]KRA12475.1 hypothetical protein ASD61_11060 [Leifsonia sp. Root60]